MKRLLENKVAVITGAGQGIGRAAALLFAREGASVVVADLDAARADEVTAEILSEGGQALAVAGDVTAAGAAETLIQAAVTAFGPSLDILVNNAGYTWDGLAHKIDDTQWDAMLAVHLTAPFRLIRAATPYMRDAARSEMEHGAPKRRKIINVSSVAGTEGNPGQANYSAAKAGVIGLTKTLAKEWGRFNINVNAVAYGWIETRLTRPKEEGGAIETGGERIALGVPAPQLEMFRALIPLGRPGTVEEAAEVMLFLASGMSDYVSGQVIKVTGGM